MTNKADREAYFRDVERTIRDYYLADPSNPYRQSGKTGGAKHWETTRRCIAQAVNANGDYLDLGCANGLLLASLVRWCAKRGFAITPHGVDFIPELIDLARKRLPAYAANFHVANTFFWQPPRRYRFVQLLLDAVPPADQHAYIARVLNEMVATPGRLIVSVYGQGTSATPAVAVETLDGLGFKAAGAAACVSASVAWIDKDPERSTW
ncbi:MAG: class I SAM-dependent methyltransferase [Chloroflexota bacterium]|nr:class I SAM-dependent methyltransferase [Chloroflexota bacterium]MDE2920552.1 class I SAM-dependent methyltransferase [Chloroflexota bacterium]